MVRELIGILIGIYITQNYTVPDIKEAFKDREALDEHRIFMQTISDLYRICVNFSFDRK